MCWLGLHDWTPWFRTQGGFRDCYGGFVLAKTKLMNGWGRRCRGCPRKEFRRDA